MAAAPSPHSVRPLAGLLKRLTTVKPQEVTLTVGLDIGSASVKALALGTRKGSGRRPIIGQQIAPAPSGQETDASDAVKTAIAGLRLPVKTVNIAVSGQWVIMRIIEMPAMKPAEIKQALPFEAQRYLPFKVQEVVIDGAVLGPAEGTKAWVLIVACKKDLIERRIDWVRRAGLEVALIDVDALALANSLLAKKENGRKLEGTCAMMNVGASLTNLVIVRGEIPYLVRDIPWGADKLVRHVAEQVGADPAAVAQALLGGAATPEIAAAMKVSTEALASELELSFDYFENRFGQPPDNVLISGGLGQGATFLEALKPHLAQPITPWAPAEGLPAQFAVAYGLALRTT